MKHEFPLHDNTYLCSLDMTHATKAQKIAWLTRIIHNELDRGEEMDEQLISECAEHLEQLSPEVSRSAEESALQLQLLLEGRREVRPSAKRHVYPRLRRALRRMVAVAVMTVMILLLSPRIYAQALVERDNKLYDRAVSRDFLHAETTLTDPQAEQIPASTYEASYSSLSAFLQDHAHLDFHYPSDLPKEQAIRSVGIIHHSEKSWIIVFSFEDPAIKSFIVQRLSQPGHMIETPSAGTYLSIGTLNYALSQKEEEGRTVFTAACYADGLRYTAEAYDPTMLKLVLTKTKTLTSRFFSDMDQFLETFDYLPTFRYPEQLPAQLRFDSVNLIYRSSANWTVTVKFDQPQSSNRGDRLTISPVADPSSVDLGADPPILSNETAEIYLISQGFSADYGHYEAVCVVDHMKYTMRIYGYDSFVAFAESLFGPLAF